MNAREIGMILGHAAAYGSVLPVLAGGFRSARRRPTERAVLMWMVTGVALSMSMWMIRALGQNWAALPIARSSKRAPTQIRRSASSRM